MHSRIFQIETKPVTEDYRTTADDYWDDHWFTNSIADYTAEDENRENSLEWLRESLQAAQGYIEYFSDDDGEGFILREGFHAAYFGKGYKAFDAALKALAEKASVETYIDDSISMDMYRLKESYDDEFSFYVQNYENGLTTLNRFLRYAKLDTHYYFGGTVDYHW